MARPSNVVVYFSTGRWFAGWSRHGVKSYVASLCIRVFTLSRFCHCSIGSGDLVLDPGMRGDRFWPSLTFLLEYPSLEEIYVLPCTRAPKIADHQCGPRRRWWPSVARWLSRGRAQSDDCVQVTSKYLRDSGVPVPNEITTPRALRKYLKAYTAVVGGSYAATQGL